MSAGTPPAGDPDPDPRLRDMLADAPETGSDFVARVRGRIHRRAAVSQVADPSWNLPKAVAVEMAFVLRHLFTAFGSKKGS